MDAQQLTQRAEMAERRTRKLKALFDELPGGAAILFVNRAGISLQYCSEGVARLSGRTVAQLRQMINEDQDLGIYEPDRVRVVEAFRATATSSAKTVDESFRLRHVGGGLVWVHLQAINCGVHDGTTTFHLSLHNIPGELLASGEIIEQYSIAALVCDRQNFRVLYANAAAFELARQNGGKGTLGVTCHEFLHGSVSPCAFCRCAEATDSRQEIYFSKMHRYYEALGRHINWQGRPAYVESLLEITEQKQMAMRLEEARADLDRVVRSLPLGIVVVRRTAERTRVMNANEFACRLLNLPLGAVVGADASLLSGGLRKEGVTLQEQLEKLFREGSLGYTLHLKETDSENEKWYYVAGALESQQNQANIKTAYVSFIDVTAQKKAEDQARSRADYLDRLYDTLPCGIVQYESARFEPPFLYLNKEGRRIYGCTPDGQGFAHVHPDDVETVAQLRRQLQQTGESVPFEYRLVQVDGTLVWVRGITARIEDANGRTIYQSVLNDVTDAKRTQAALAESETLGRVALDSADMMMWVYDRDADLLIPSSAAARRAIGAEPVAGAWRAELERGLVLQESVEDYMRLHTDLDDGKASASAVIHFNPELMHPEWMRVAYTALPGQHRAIGIGEDVGALIEAQKRFEEEEAYRRATSPNLVSSGRIDLTDDRLISFESIDGQTVPESSSGTDEIFSKLSEGIVSDQSRAAFCARFTRGAMLGGFTRGESVFSQDTEREQDGQRVWLSVRTRLAKRPDTNHIIAFFSMIDITQEHLLQRMADVIVQKDCDYAYVVDVDRHNARMTSVAAAYRGKLPELLGDVDVDLPRCLNELGQVDEPKQLAGRLTLATVLAHLKDNETFVQTYRMREKNGIRTKQVQFVYLDQADHLLLLTGSDVTEAVAEQESRNETLSRLLDQANAANKAKSKFLANMSHDIRTPMNAILGMTQLAMDDEKTDPSTQDYLKKIEESGSYLLKLINDVLDMSRIENGRLNLNLETVNGAEFLQTVTEMVNPVAEEAGVTLETDFSVSATPWVHMDRVRTEQIYVNLLTNAIKFSPKGGKVAWGVREASRKDGTVLFESSVRDWGSGMSSEFAQRCFQPFEQENAVEHGNRSGVGLGLSIVHSLVELMSGTISVKSEQGSGTTFTVRLPFTIAEPPEKASEPTAQSQQEQKDALEGTRVLVCEDHPMNTEIMVRLLARRGCTAETAADGQQGVEKFAQSEAGYYDAILMDIRMPVMDGLEAAEAIRAMRRPDSATVPILAVSANAYEEDKELSRKAGMSGHLAKPVQPAQLYAALEQCIQPKARPTEEQQPDEEQKPAAKEPAGAET